MPSGSSLRCVSGGYSLFHVLEPKAVEASKVKFYTVRFPTKTGTVHLPEIHSAIAPVPVPLAWTLDENASLTTDTNARRYVLDGIPHHFAGFLSAKRRFQGAFPGFLACGRVAESSLLMKPIVCIVSQFQFSQSVSQPVTVSQCQIEMNPGPAWKILENQAATMDKQETVTVDSSSCQRSELDCGFSHATVNAIHFKFPTH